MNEFQIITLAILASSLFAQLWLNLRQRNILSAGKNSVPNNFVEAISLDIHQKSIDYSQAKIRLSNLELITGILLTAILTVGGLINLFDQLLAQWIETELVRGITLIYFVSLLLSLIDLPFSLYRTFVIEEKFGFNNSTLSTFISDRIKGAILAIMLLTPVLWLILWLMDNIAAWWILAAATMVSFSLLISWLYPTLIAPIFNKFTPLEDPQLKDRILRLMQETGFQSRGIYLMDGSRRSSHGNAYFTGLGNNKRVVFFDTLLKQLAPDEIEAVLAHELGHFRKKHIIKGMILSAVMVSIGFFILSLLVNWTGLYQLAQIDNPSSYNALLLFILLSPHVTLWLSPIFNGISRRHEYEADAFAAEHAQPTSLIQALIKLYRENASPVITDSVYSLFHDSHPPASLRIQQLQAT